MRVATVREGNNTRAAHHNPDNCNHVLEEEEMKLSAAFAAYIIYETRGA